MKAQELRIGNYIQYSKSGKIEPVYQLVTVIGDSINEESYPGTYAPIPLSEDWLVKFGFEHKHTNGEQRYSLGHHHIYYLQGFVFRLFGTNDHDCEVEIKYVHQLQNLYFALSGEELT